ncbi:hypothetical protein Pfo_005291 [Paulownia fortunei]|nr:hypothetical protein Pfo_005291 [Paulownia fortunei]
MAVESCGDIYALPEDCIAKALSLTSPKDACRLSAVASTFRSASESDTVWDRFLPSDYRDIISRAVDGPDSLLAKFHSKKDLYLHLCDLPILIDGGRKSFSLEKWSGKKCYMLAARELFIVWGDTPQYWQWISLPESRFSEVAELPDVCWFEIPRCSYGFEHHSAEAFVAIGGHESEKRTICLDPDGAERMGLFYHRLAHVQRQQDVSMERNTEYPKKRSDRWMEAELGEFFVKGGQDADLEVNLMQVTSNWKSGLIIQGIEIRPKECK